MKLTTLQERCLASFFKIELLVGDFVGNEEISRLFSSLCDVFLVNEEDREELFSLTRLDEVSAIKCESDYNLHKRIQEFLRLSHGERPSIETIVANIKGRAITALKESGYNAILDATKPATYSFLTNASQCGIIEAMRSLGIMQVLGLFTGEDKASGLRLLNRCAKWNDPDAILAMLAYDEGSRAQNISRLYSVSNGTPFEAILDTAREKYGFTRVAPSNEAELIEQAIGLNIVKPQIYSPQVARIAYSEILDEGDKTRLVLNNKNIVGEVNDLPLALKKVPLVLNSDTLGGLLDRESEKNSVIQSILYASETNTLSPCIVTNDDFVALDYMETIAAAFPDANIIDIDARALGRSDFNLDKNHVLVRDIDESKRNLVLIVLRGVADFAVVELLSRFLKDTARDDFRLVMPGITLNLESVLPICICDTACLKYIKHLCDCIEASPIEEGEFDSLIDKLLLRKSIEYGISELSIEKDAKDALNEAYKSFMEIAIALDKLIYSFKGKGADKVITREMVEQLSKIAKDKRTKLGF